MSNDLKARVAKLEKGQEPARWLPHKPAVLVLDESDPASVANYEARRAAIEADMEVHGYQWQEGDPPVMYILRGPDPDGLFPDPALYSNNPDYAWNGVPWQLCMPGDNRNGGGVT